MRLVAAAAIVVVALACARSTHLHGRYLFGFEASAFQPADSCEVWFLSGNLGSVRSRVAPADLSGQNAPYPRFCTDIDVEGRLSPTGTYGHLGGYSREFTAERAREVGPMRRLTEHTAHHCFRCVPDATLPHAGLRPNKGAAADTAGAGSP